MDIHLICPCPAQADPSLVTVMLESRDGSSPYASETFEDIKEVWHKHVAVLTANGTDHDARLTVRGKGGPFLLDVLSLFPEENGREGKISPFRNDLLSLLKGLRPRYPSLFDVQFRWRGFCRYLSSPEGFARTCHYLRFLHLRVTTRGFCTLCLPPEGVWTYVTSRSFCINVLQPEGVSTYVFLRKGFAPLC